MATPSYIKLVASEGSDALAKRKVRADIDMLAERDRIHATDGEQS
jgi:hypothetical protein